MIDPSGRVAATVNYKTGNMALLPVHADGTLGEPFAVEQSEESRSARVAMAPMPMA